jgi:hypothetical protein
MMRRFPKCLLLAATAAGLCSADEPETAAPKPYNGSSYVTFGAGTCQHQITNLSGGGGAEGFVWRGLSLGADAGYFRFQNGGVGFGIGNLDIGYHFVNRKRPGKVDPFVRGTVAGLAASTGGAAAAWGAGGGVNYWFKPRVAFRTEFRVHAIAGERIAMGRIGFAFR